uniref:Proteasome inhibitor PI31 subunit n=1 Tax=Zeugodacus cucurbitae TaxID=28588 RepID=A0A0A1XHU5_ZEUCU
MMRKNQIQYKTMASSINISLLWELFDILHAKNMRNFEDVLVSYTHLNLTALNAFECLGVGEDKTIASDEEGFEDLPDRWNLHGIRYALRYRKHGQLYILLAQKSRDLLVINLFNVQQLKVSNIALNAKECVKQLNGALRDVLSDAEIIQRRIEDELIKPVLLITKIDSSQQTDFVEIHPTSHMSPEYRYTMSMPESIYLGSSLAEQRLHFRKRAFPVQHQARTAALDYSSYNWFNY